MRHWLHEVGWEWKRAKVAAKDDDPERVEKLARIRLAFGQLRAGVALFFADALDINLLPKDHETKPRPQRKSKQQGCQCEERQVTKYSLFSDKDCFAALAMTLRL